MAFSPFLFTGARGHSVRAVSRIVAVAALIVTLMGCAWAQNSTSTSRKGISRNKIVVPELTFPVGGMSTYELISQYKSNWLQKRGQKSIKSPSPIQVYVDNTSTPYGTVSSLRQIPAENVETIQYFTGQEAQSRFGLGNVSGALLVKTRGGGS